MIKAFFKISAGIYNNFGSKKRNCYDFDILKIWAEYKKGGK